MHQEDEDCRYRDDWMVAEIIAVIIFIQTKTYRRRAQCRFCPCVCIVCLCFCLAWSTVQKLSSYLVWKFGCCMSSLWAWVGDPKKFRPVQSPALNLHSSKSVLVKRASVISAVYRWFTNIYTKKTQKEKITELSRFNIKWFQQKIRATLMIHYPSV